MHLTVDAARGVLRHVHDGGNTRHEHENETAKLMQSQLQTSNNMTLAAYIKVRVRPCLRRPGPALFISFALGRFISSLTFIVATNPGNSSRLSFIVFVMTLVMTLVNPWTAGVG